MYKRRFDVFKKGDGVMRMVPYIRLNGNCEEALNYYKRLLDGETTYIMRYGEAPGGMWNVEGSENKILHASLLAGEVVLYLSDILEDMDLTEGETVSLTLELEPEERMESIYEELAKDGRVVVPMQDTFWNARHATVTDKFGVTWIINQDKA
ncbi:MAG: hypothetical protein C0604_07505 [Clostridiales bacterium]|nr:MAG: hypothetical protein C0604_07505 [Clostridiales bacterium]